MKSIKIPRINKEKSEIFIFLVTTGEMIANRAVPQVKIKIEMPALLTSPPIIFV